MNDQLKYLDSRITKIEIILMALLHKLELEAVVNVQEMNTPILRKKK